MSETINLATDDLEIHEIVQIDPERDDGWGGCLLVVTEVKSWGVQGYVQMPLGGQAYYRSPNGNFKRTGAKAHWIAP